MNTKKTDQRQSNVTVIIPAWNLQTELSEAVASVRQQDEPCRIIVVNNASDTPLPPLSGVETIKLTKRVSVGEARNIGIDTVSTPYVLFMDADDKLLPGTLRHLRSQLDKRPELSGVTGKIVKWYVTPPVRQGTNYPPRYAYRLQRFRRLFAILNACRFCSVMIGAAMLRTDVVRAAGKFASTNFAEDWVLSIGVCFSGRFMLTDHPSRLYRIVPSGNSLLSQNIHKRSLYRDAMRDCRDRIRQLPSVPRWAKVLLPLVWAGQQLFYLSRQFQRNVLKRGRVASPSA